MNVSVNLFFHSDEIFQILVKISQSFKFCDFFAISFLPVSSDICVVASETEPGFHRTRVKILVSYKMSIKDQCRFLLHVLVPSVSFLDLVSRFFPNEMSGFMQGAL